MQVSRQSAVSFQGGWTDRPVTTGLPPFVAPGETPKQAVKSFLSLKSWKASFIDAIHLLNPLYDVRKQRYMTREERQAAWTDCKKVLKQVFLLQRPKFDRV